MSTVIPASEAKAKFSELLDRVRSGESFSITLHGEETAKLVPAGRPSLEDVPAAIARIKASRSILNPPVLELGSLDRDLRKAAKAEKVALLPNGQKEISTVARKP